MSFKFLQVRRHWMSALLDLMVTLCQRIDQGLPEGEASIGRDDAGRMRDPLMNLCHRVSDLFQRAVSAQSLLQQELARMADLRKLRDEHAGRIKELLKQLRALVSTCYGQTGLRALGLVGRLPGEPEALARQATVTSDHLSEPAVDLGTPTEAPAELDTATVAHRLRDGAKALKRCLGSLREAQLRKESAAAYRNELLALFDHDAVHSARLVKALCDLTDQKDLARKARRSLKNFLRRR